MISIPERLSIADQRFRDLVNHLHRLGRLSIGVALDWIFNADFDGLFRRNDCCL